MSPENVRGFGIVVVGGQFGDEGKGKVVDYYASKPYVNAVVRFNGGSNAGHTIVAEDQKYDVHILPSGLVFEKPSFIGNGVVVDFDQLEAEFTQLREKKGKDLQDLLQISERAHVVLPHHKILDSYQEQVKSKFSRSAGTTKRGIGPSYSDKSARFGIRVVDLWDEDRLTHQLRVLEDYYRPFAEFIPDFPDFETTREALVQWREHLRPNVSDVGLAVEELLNQGHIVLFEGAQATLLDIDHGLYPYGTSSTCTAAGASAGVGVGPHHLRHRLGVVKAYTSRVGEGPLLGELRTDEGPGNVLQVEGAEYGTTTGRPRRIGWLDLVATRYACRVNGLTGLCLTKVDVVGLLDEFNVITGYSSGQDDRKTDKFRMKSYPANLSEFDKLKPILKSFKGWGRLSPEEWFESVQNGRESLPAELQTFLSFVEEETKTPVVLLSYGPSRQATLELSTIVD